MANITIQPDLAERLELLAKRQGKPFDALVETVLTQYVTANPVRTEAEQAELLRQDRLRLYERARRYWRNADDPRQELTDEQLDEQFWVFDQDSIPRLKADQDTIQLPPNPLKKMLEILNPGPAVAWEDQTDDSEHTKEILNTEYTDYLAARMNRPEVSKHGEHSD